MGSICRMRDTQRAYQVLRHAPEGSDGALQFSHPLTAYKGKTVRIVDVAMHAGDDALEAWADLEVDGEEVTVPLGEIAEVCEEGVCGYELERYFSAEELAGMIEAALADKACGFDERDRELLTEDLECLREG